MKRHCLRVDPKKGEPTRMALNDLGLLDKGLLIESTADGLFFPLIEGFDMSALKKVVKRPALMERDVSEVLRRPRSYKDVVEVPENLRPLLPSSLDIIGHVAIVKLPDPLVPYKKNISRAFLEANRNIRSVAMDRGVEGDLRIRDLEVIGGAPDLETVHVENGLKFKLDPSKVYFSPRLSTERMRIASATKDGERVLDMFSGVGPFGLTVARYSQAINVACIDLNPDCVRFLEENISLNSLQNRVEHYLGDAGEVAPSLGTFDRVIMNLPHRSMEFLETSLWCVEKGFIHLYTITGAAGIVSGAKKVQDIAREQGKETRIDRTREVHQYSASMQLVVLDIEVL